MSANKPARESRVIVVPVSASIDESLRLLDWYAENLRSPGDRLVLVRLLIPDYCLDEAEQLSSTIGDKRRSAAPPVVKRYRRGGGGGGGGGGGSASSSAVSTSSESVSNGGGGSGGGGGSRSGGICIEAQMERQLEASVAQEALLVRRLREQARQAKDLAAAGGAKKPPVGASFRFIHAFGREFTDSLLSIAAEQGACAVLAPLSAFAAEHDLARTYHLYKKARIGVIHAPDF